MSRQNANGVARASSLRACCAVLSATVALTLMLLTLIAPTAEGAASDFGFSEFTASLSTTQAGAHPDFTTVFEVKEDPATPADGKGFRAPYSFARSIAIGLPPGLTGNPNAVSKCTYLQLSTSLTGGGCPQDSQVGVTKFHAYLTNVYFTEPVFNMAAPGGDSVARLGFFAYNFPVFLNVRLSPENDYGLVTTLEGITSFFPFSRAETTLWGVPASPVHDNQRLTVQEAVSAGGELETSPTRPSGLAPVPFMTNSTRCGVPQRVDGAMEVYGAPGQATASAEMPAIQGCGKLSFTPSIDFSPTTVEADSPSGLDVEIKQSQSGFENPGDNADSTLKKATVTLPEGVTLNPAAARGLVGCSEEEMGLISSNPVRFDSSDPACPDGSKIGTVEIHSPLLAESVSGSLYIAKQSDNPFGSLLAGYLVAQGQGVVIKLAGRIELNPASGQITAIFDGNPQQPFDSLKLHFKEGPHGVLATPSGCGSYSINSSLVPWSASDPENPSAAEVVGSESQFQITNGPHGGACPSGSFVPGFDAGTLNPVAGEFSSFALRVRREDGTQRLGRLEAMLPPGLVGKLAGIPYCPDATVASIPSGVGSGVSQIAAPSCPAGSQVGTVSAGVGVGDDPFFIESGRVYLAGPYRGAPLSLIVVTSAVAGPFDLGNVVVRTALQIDPETARITAVSDPFPTILEGIPVDLRDLRLRLDRPNFTLNPTSCERMGFAGTISSIGGFSTPLAQRFQVASCASLGFKPRLSLRFSGPTHRSAYPRLRAEVKARPGDANIGRAQVTLPRTEFLENGHIRTVCTRVQYRQGSCPAGSIYGYAKAWTPLLDAPLQGPVYLRSSNHQLPDLVASLDGQIHIDLPGRIDSVHGRIRNTFESVPDAPVSRFVLTMQGGKKGLLVNNTELCRAKPRARAVFEGQNGKGMTLKPRVKTDCGRSR